MANTDTKISSEGLIEVNFKAFKKVKGKAKISFCFMSFGCDLAKMSTYMFGNGQSPDFIVGSKIFEVEKSRGDPFLLDFDETDDVDVFFFVVVAAVRV